MNGSGSFITNGAKFTGDIKSRTDMENVANWIYN